MSTSHGHAVRLMSATELDKVRRLTERWPQHPYQCGAPRCAEAPTHVCSYRYVTGRAGRVTRAEKEYCKTHADAFSQKHGLAMLAIAEGPAADNSGPSNERPEGTTSPSSPASDGKEG